MEDYGLKTLRLQFKKKGVFYTPKEQAELVKSFIDVENYSEVYDPTCGRGNLLSVYGDDIVKYGQDIDEGLFEVKEFVSNVSSATGLQTLITPKVWKPLDCYTKKN